MKLLGSGPDMATELKGRAEREGLREAFLREALVARLQGFGGTSLLGFKDLHAVI